MWVVFSKEAQILMGVFMGGIILMALAIALSALLEVAETRGEKPTIEDQRACGDHPALLAYSHDGGRLVVCEAPSGPIVRKVTLRG